MEMMKTTSRAVVIEHHSHEENLAAAKHSVRSRPGARLNRVSDSGEDIIDVVVGCDVVERHVCHQVFESKKSPSVKYQFRIEDLALYQ